MKLSPFVLAGTALLTGSTHVKGVEMSKKIQNVESDEVAVEKKDDSVLIKKESKASALRRVASRPNRRDSFPTRTQAKQRHSSRSGFGSPDSGALTKLPSKESTPERLRLRLTYGHYALNKQHSKNMLRSRLRHLEVADTACMGIGACNNSYPICAKNASCNGLDACSDSPGLHAEDYACVSRYVCQGSPGIVVGKRSCRAVGKQGSTCRSSPDACIGQQSCFGNRACRDSREIQVDVRACNNDEACQNSPSSTIHPFSCNEESACRDSTNLTIKQYLCNEYGSCRYSSNATIGQYACNCEFCCQWLEPGCVIPGFACNEVEGSCSFNSTVMGCPF